jgi:hypothetical protein
MCRSLLSASSLRHSPQVKRLVAPPLSSSQAPRRFATLLKSSASSLRHSPQVKRLVAPPFCTVLSSGLHHRRSLGLHRPLLGPAPSSFSRSAPSSPRACTIVVLSICTVHSSVLQSKICTVLYIYLVLHHPRSAPSTPRSCNPRSAPSSTLHHDLSSTSRPPAPSTWSCTILDLHRPLLGPAIQDLHRPLHVYLVLHHQPDLHRPLYYTPLQRVPVRAQAPPRSPRRPRYVSSSSSYRRLLVS